MIETKGTKGMARTFLLIATSLRSLRSLLSLKSLMPFGDSHAHFVRSE